MTDQIILSDDVALPLSMITHATAIAGVSGSGKSNVGVRVIEQVHAYGVPFVVIDPKPDWWGLRLAADGESPGLPVVIVGGDRADIPLTASATFAEALVLLLVRERMSVIVDISEFDDDDERTAFVAPFLRALLRHNNEPRYVVIDEFEEIAPEPPRKATGEMVRAVSRLAKTGRSKGLGLLVLFQRAASVSKQPLAQCKVFIALLTTYDRDKKVVDAWEQDHEASKREIVSSLGKLQAGEGWVIAPPYDVVTRTQFHRRETFDSGATPEIGQVIRRDVPANIDVASLNRALTGLVEHLDDENPDALHARIRHLEAQVAEADAHPPVSVVQEMVPYVPDGLEAAVRQFAGETVGFLDGMLLTLDEHVGSMRLNRDGLAERLEKIDLAFAEAAAIGDSPITPAHIVSNPRANGKSHSTAARPLAAPMREPGTGPSTLKAGARRMAEVLVRYFPEPLTRFEVSTLAHVSKGGTLSEYARSLLDSGFAVEEAGVMRPTDAAMEMFPDLEGVRYTPMQIVQMYDGDLKAGARRMLDELMKAHPRGMSRAVLSERADVSKGGTLSEYARSLIKRGLATETRGEIAAAEVLYKR